MLSGNNCQDLVGVSSTGEEWYFYNCPTESNISFLLHEKKAKSFSFTQPHDNFVRWTLPPFHRGREEAQGIQSDTAREDLQTLDCLPSKVMSLILGYLLDFQMLKISLICLKKD